MAAPSVTHSGHAFSLPHPHRLSSPALAGSALALVSAALGLWTVWPAASPAFRLIGRVAALYLANARG
jgi:hypothetical protein